METGLWHTIYSSKWVITGFFGMGFAAALVMWFEFPLWKMAVSGALVALVAWRFPHEPLVPFAEGVIALTIMATTSDGETEDWFNESWGFAKQIMPIDRAGWHMSKRLKIPENIRLIPQPPYSPELNPAEHVSEHLREKATTNKAFTSLDRLQDALCLHLRALENAPEKLRSITDFPYLRVI